MINPADDDDKWMQNVYQMIGTSEMNKEQTKHEDSAWIVKIPITA